MIPIPKTKAQEVIEALEPYMAARKLPDEITLRRLKTALAKSHNVDPLCSYLALGMIAVLQWDDVAVDNNFKAALLISDTAEMRKQYAISLQMLGKYAEAAREACIASERAPTDLGALRRAISYSNAAGEFDMANRLCAKFNLRSPSRPHDDADAINEAHQVLVSLGFSQSTVVECNKVAFDLLRERHVVFSGVRCESDLQEQNIMLFIEVDLDEDQIDELDNELGQRLFDKIPDFRPDIFWVGYEKTSVVQ